MNILNLIATGFAGSSALTGLHQILRNMEGAPRVDLLGKQAIEKALGDDKANFSDKSLYWSSIAGDILSNSAFYSIIARAKNPVFTGAIVGAVIGVMTLVSPNILNLDKDLVKSSDTKKYITIGYYIFGGIVAGLMASTIKRSSH